MSEKFKINLDGFDGEDDDSIENLEEDDEW